MRPRPGKIGYQIRSSDTAKRAVKAARLRAANLSKSLNAAHRKSPRRALRIAKRHLSGIRDRKEYRQDALTLVDWGRRRGAAAKRLAARALLDHGGAPAALFLVQAISEMKRSEARPYMKAYLRSGGSVAAVARWLRSAGMVLKKHRVKSRGTAGAVVDSLEDAADWLVDTLEDGVDAVLESVEAVVDAVIDAGVSMAAIITEAVKWTAAQAAQLFTALIEAGVALGEMVKPMFRMAYAMVDKLVDGLLEAGARAIDIISEAATSTYWALRRVASGIVNKLGVEKYLDAILQSVAGAADALWSRALKAVRYVLEKAEETLAPIVDWVAAQGAAAMEGVLRAWETMGAALEDFYEGATRLAVGVWEQIGEATARIGNSLHYLLDYVKEDLVPAVFNIVRGALRAGYALASLMAWAVEQTLDVVVEAVRAALEIGTTIGALIRNTLRNPASALDNVMRALRSVGRTLADVYQAAIVETAQEFIGEVTLCLRRIGEAVRSILYAVAEVALGAIGAVISVLLNTLASYRPLSAAEKGDARKVFGDALDYDRIYVSAESLSNDVIFGIQDYFSGNPESRAFTTDTLINFDVDEGIERHTLIHELTHVWQAESTGPFYLSEAIHAQATEGYNYGYIEDNQTIRIPVDFAGTTKLFGLGEVTGEGGDMALVGAGGDFEAFNREQQGQIMMHYFVRRVLLGLPQAQYAAWQPYVDYVRTA